MKKRREKLAHLTVGRKVINEDVRMKNAIEVGCLSSIIAFHVLQAKISGILHDEEMKRNEIRDGRKDKIFHHTK